MKRFSSQLKKQSESIKLSASERTDLHERLVSYMEYHPLPNKQAQKKADEYIATEPFRAIAFSKLHLKGILGILALVLIVGVPFFAERTLPGDPLYLVKVQFNEEVRSTFALSPYEKVEWEAERLSRRVSEARLLASEGKLTQEFEENVAEAVRKHSDAAQKEIETLRETDAEEAAIAEIMFASALDVQSVVFKAEGEKASTTPQSGVIAFAIEEQREEANQNSSETENIPSIERLFGRIETETTRVYELLESIRNFAAPQEVVDIERRLEDLNRKLTLAFSQRESDEKQARLLLRDALQGIKKINSFMTDIDVRETVVIEELVPVEWTEEEYIAAVEEKFAYVSAVETVVNERLASSTLISKNIRGKVEAGLLELDEFSERASSSLATSSVVEAYTAARDAEALARDILKVLNMDVNETDIETKLPDTETEEIASSTETVDVEAASSTTEGLEDEVGDSEEELEDSATTTEPSATSSTISE